MKNQIGNQVKFSHSTYRGLRVLGIICFVYIGIPYLGEVFIGHQSIPYKLELKPTGFSGHVLKIEKSGRVRLDINRADSNDFDKLPGIGSYLAMRIIKFRENLGGFYHTEQLMDVYGFDSLLYKVNESLIHCESISVRKINLSTVHYAQLESHPYISPLLAREIILQRQKGKLRNEKDFFKFIL